MALDGILAEATRVARVEGTGVVHVLHGRRGAAPPLIALGLALLALSGCAKSSVEPLAKPTKVDAFCHTYAQRTSIGSVLTSIYALPTPGPDVPTLSDYKSDLDAQDTDGGGGAIAYYSAAPLRILQPSLARELGAADGYVVVREAVLTNHKLSATKRYVYLDVLDHGTYVWRVFTAADAQNLCNEGNRAA